MKTENTSIQSSEFPEHQAPLLCLDFNCQAIIQIWPYWAWHGYNYIGIHWVGFVGWLQCSTLIHLRGVISRRVP